MDKITPLTIIVQIVNFLILYQFILKPLVFKPLQTAMNERETEARKKLDEADSINKEAKALKEDYSVKLKQAHQEAQTIVQGSQKEGDQLKAELVEEGRKESHRLLEKAQSEIATEKQKAISELRTQVATLSVNMATRLLAESLDADAQKKIVDKMLVKAGKSSAS